MEGILDLYVTMYSWYKDVDSTKTVNLAVWLSDTSYKEQVELVRREKDPYKRKELKNQLPRVTISGRFENSSKEGLICHSGLVCLDIDFKDNTHIFNYADLKKQISRIKNVAYCGLSVSGEGYFVIMPIRYPDKHEQQYRALVSLFWRKYNIRIDRQCSNVNRTRTRSYDPDAYWNYDPIEFEKCEEDIVYPKHSNEADTDDIITQRVETCISAIVEQRIDITGNGYEWYQIACSFANAFGENGRQYFHAISQFYRNGKYKYSEREANQKFTYCLRKGFKNISINTFFYYCKLIQIS